MWTPVHRNNKSQTILFQSLWSDTPSTNASSRIPSRAAFYATLFDQILTYCWFVLYPTWFQPPLNLREQIIIKTSSTINNHSNINRNQQLWRCTRVEQLTLGLCNSHKMACPGLLSSCASNHQPWDCLVLYQMALHTVPHTIPPSIYLEINPMATLPPSPMFCNAFCRHFGKSLRKYPLAMCACCSYKTSLNLLCGNKMIQKSLCSWSEDRQNQLLTQ